jgi:RNA-binding protein
MSKKASQDIRQLRAIAHKLKPVVTIAGNGLSEGVLAELERALNDHELIKIKLAVGSREARSQVRWCSVLAISWLSSVGRRSRIRGCPI